MKKLAILLAILFVGVLSYSQESDFNRSFRIGLGSSIGYAQPIRFERINNLTKYQGRGIKIVNMDITKFFNNHNAIKVGLSYSKVKVKIDPKTEFDIPIPPFTESFDIISVPISYNFYFKKLYYIGVGTILDFEIPNYDREIITDKQSGLGLILEAGKEFKINWFTIQVAPCLQLHSFAPFSTMTGQQRLFVASINIGINYSFKQNSH